MIKRITNLICCILIAHLGTAQIADGSLAPNISGVDLEGNSYDLYQILGSGKVVLIDISATWCGPCFTLHRTHVLDLINQTYGPQGTDEMVVLLLEGDDATDLADLQGTGDYTVGDWTSCTSIPILDNMGSAADDYQINAVPTYFIINPADSTTKKLNLFTTIAQPVTEMLEIDLIELPQWDASKGYICDEATTQYVCSEANTFAPQFDLYNLGASTITSLSFDIFVNGALYTTQNWTGNIPSLNKKKLVLDPIPIAGASEISVIINQAGDGNLTNNNLLFDVQPSNASTLGEVTVEINTDNLGAETYWHIADDAGNIVASGGNPWVGTTNIGIGFGANFPQTPPGTYQSNQTYTETVSLEPATCYDFVITDYYGGGLRSNSGGGYRVIDHLGNVLFSGAYFESIVTHPFFSTTVSGTNDRFTDINIQLYANPAHDQLNLSMDVAQAEITIFDLQGKPVYQAEWTQKPIAISHLSHGVYILRVSSGKHTSTKRFIKG